MIEISVLNYVLYLIYVKQFQIMKKYTVFYIVVYDEHMICSKKSFFAFKKILNLI